MKVFLDTHALIYLFDGQVRRFGKRSRSLIERGDLYCSAASRLELRFLNETRNLRPAEGEVISALAASVGLIESQDPFPEVVKEAVDLSWTRDVFDRLIVANALLHGARLVTRDERILANCSAAVW